MSHQHGGERRNYIMLTWRREEKLCHVNTVLPPSAPCVIDGVGGQTQSRRYQVCLSCPTAAALGPEQ